MDILLGTDSWPWTTQLDDAIAIVGYQLYKAPNERWRVYLKPWETLRRGYHLHIVEYDSPHWHDHLLFRNYLRTHPEHAERYATLKLDLAARLGGRRGSYQNGKAELVRELQHRANEWRSTRQSDSVN